MSTSFLMVSFESAPERHVGLSVVAEFIGVHTDTETHRPKDPSRNVQRP